MGAHQHEPQDVVLQQAAAVGHGARSVLVAFGVGEEQRLLARGDRLGAQAVDDPALRRGHQPTCRVRGHAVGRPGAAGRLDGVPEGVLHQVEASELREEQGDEASPLLAHDLLEGLVGSHDQ